MKVAIAGAGAVGRSIARELLQNKHDVLLIDKDPGKIDARPDPGCGVAARRRVRAGQPRGRLAGGVRRRHRRDRRRQGQPRRVAAGQDRVLGAAGGRADQPPGQRVAVHRGVGRRRRGVHAARACRARRGGCRGRRPRAAVRTARGSGEPGRGHPAGRCAVAGKCMRDLDLPKDAALVAIIRGQRVITPTPEEPLESGDELLFVALPEAEAAIRSAVIG